MNVIMNALLDDNDIKEGCGCEANLFYKNYKERIEAILGKSDSKTGSIRGKKADTGKKKRQNPELSLRSKGSDASISIKKDSVHKRSTSKDLDIQKTKKVRSGSITKTTSKFEAPAPTVSGTELKDEVILPTEDHEDEVSIYEEALSTKLDEIFGEEEVEDIPITEQGYYEFDRFLELSSDVSTVCKMSSKSTTSTMHIIEEEEEEEDEVEEEEKEELYHVEKPPEEWMSDSMNKALDYLKTHKIGEFFKFMGAHLVASNTCNPIEFLINLMDNCINYRLGYTEPPLLYQLKHIESLFNTMDPMGSGEIDLNQYGAGMKTLGIKEFNTYPEVSDKNMVNKKIFLDEAYKYLKKDLDELLQCSAPVGTLTTMVTSISSLKGETIDSTIPGQSINY